MREIEGLGQEDHFSLYGLTDHWQGEYTDTRKKNVAWNHVSPSQIENFNKCKRSWYFKSILKVPDIQKGHQALGESFHLVLEKVPKGLSYPNRADTSATADEWDKADAMAKIALPLLPIEPPGKVIKREWGITLDTYVGGPRMVGYIDLAIPTGIGWPALVIPTNEAIVADYKTLSDFRYMKTPQELAESVQMMTYAKWAIEDWPSGLSSKPFDAFDTMPEHVRLVHLYARTKPPFTRSSIRHESAIVTPAQINSFWDKTLDTVREMQQVTTCGSPDDVEAQGALNGHCEAYGGCSYRDKCGISKESGIKNLFQITKKPTSTQEPPNMSGSSILAKIQAARAAQTGSQPQQTVVANSPATTAPVAATSGPVAGTPVASKPELTSGSDNKATGPLSGLMAKINASGKGQPTLAGAAYQAVAKERGLVAAAGSALLGTGELKNTTVSNIGELIKLASGIVPSDAPPRTQEAITTPGQAVEDPEAEEVTPATEEDEEETNATPTESPTQPIISSTEEVPKRRGRPSREEMAAREAAERKKFEDAVEAEIAKRGGAINAPVQADAQQLKDMQTEVNSWKSAAERFQAERDQARKASPNAQQGCTLYVDCYPMKGDRPVDFFEWIGPIAAAVADSSGVKDYRLIQYNSKGLLATHIRELVKAEGLPSSMVIPGFAAGADIALEVLTPLVKQVIKKV